MPNLIDPRKFSIYALNKGTNEVVIHVDKEEIPEGKSGLDVTKILASTVNNGEWFILELSRYKTVMINTKDYSGFRVTFH